MTSEDQERFLQLAAALPQDTRLRLSLTRHERNAAFEDFGRRLGKHVPAVDLVVETEDGVEPPWMETTSGIRFYALPQGDKLDSLIEALAPSRGMGPSLPSAHRDLLDRMPLPAAVRLYIAPGCPHCPKALRQWVALANAGERLKLHVIDAALFPEMARAEGVTAVPTLVVTGQLRWSGRIPVVEVLEQLVTRDPSRLSAEALDGIIKEGQAAQVARSMIDSGTLFPAIADLLTHPKWPARLGAMVVMEEIAAADRRLASQLVPTLQERYADLDDAVRGDVLYILGEIGDQGILPFLQDSMKSSSHPEVRQAAMEAVTAIQARSGISSTEMH